MSKIIIGFVGVPCSGSGTAAAYLKEKHGFFYTSTSDEVRKEIRKRGEEITRDSLQRVAGELRLNFGPEVLAQRAWKKVKAFKNDKAIVDSLRGIEEVNFLKKQPSFYLIAVSANPRLRFERMKKRNREKDPTSWRDFLKTEKRDKESEGRNIEACLKAADFVVENNGTVKELNQKIEEVLKKLKDKGISI